MSTPKERAQESKLPPMPETNYNAYSDGSEPLYTAEHMRDFAHAAIELNRSAICSHPQEQQPGTVTAEVRRAFENIRNNYEGWRDNPNFEVLERALFASQSSPVVPEGKKAKIQLESGSWPVISLGYGLIEVAEGFSQDGTHALIFGRNGSGEIGAPTEPNRTHLPGETLAVVTFANAESLDVVVETLGKIRSKLLSAAPSAPVETKEQIRNAALSEIEEKAFALYKAPFKFNSGYIFDACDNMVADDAQASTLRLRGWGRISYMEGAEELQDASGELIAKALTEFWQSRSLQSEQRGEG